MTAPAPAPDDARLRRLLGGPDTAWLVERVRRRIADGAALDTTVTLPRASAAQRHAVELLLGRAPGSGASLTVALLGRSPAVGHRPGQRDDRGGQAVRADL